MEREIERKMEKKEALRRMNNFSRLRHVSDVSIVISDHISFTMAE